MSARESAYQTTLPLSEPSALELRFAAFHRENPQVYAAFERFALEAMRSGHRVGAKAIWERLRWYVRLETTDRRRGEWKLNNSMTAYYSRELMRRRPEFEGFFETRRVRGEEGN